MYFADPAEANHWIWCVDKHVAHWVKGHSKSYWEMVRFVGIRRGTLNPKLSRTAFAELLLKACPSWFSATDTPTSLKHSMDKFRYIRELDRFERLRDTDLPKAYEKELNDLFDKPTEPVESTATVMPTMESRLHDYLYKEVKHYKYAKVVERPTYCNFSSNFSLEQFVSKHFYDKGQPTQIYVYECIPNRVDEQTVTMLAGRYMYDRRIKLYIVSTNGYDKRVQARANERDVGLVRINPALSMDEECFILPRSESNSGSERSYSQMIESRQALPVPLLVADGDYWGTSLLRRTSSTDSVAAVSSSFHVPLLTNVEIENMAYEMVREEATQYARQLRCVDYRSNNIPYFEINPYQIARKRGINYKWKQIKHKKQLASINLHRHEVTLSADVGRYSPRERFSMSHEVGHDKLHSHYGLIASQLDEKSRKLLERQANHFASCLLMPRELTCLMYEIYWKKEFGNKTVAPLPVVKDMRYSSHIFQKIIGPAARHLNVSMDALMWRLYDIGLVSFC